MKYEKVEETSDRMKDQLYHLEQKSRSLGKVTSEQLEKVTAELNQMTILYKQKEKEVEVLKRKPVEDANRKRENFEHAKELVSKMEGEQSYFKKNVSVGKSGEKPSKDHSHRHLH